MNKTIILTKQIINNLKTKNGGHTKILINSLGFSYPPESGWQKSLIGKEMSYFDFKKCLIKSKNPNIVESIKLFIPNDLYIYLTMDSVEEKLQINENTKMVSLSKIEEKSKTMSKNKLNKYKKSENKRLLIRSTITEKVLDMGVKNTIRFILDNNQNLNFNSKKKLEEIYQKNENELSEQELFSIYNHLKLSGNKLIRHQDGSISTGKHRNKSDISKSQKLYVIRFKEDHALKIGISEDVIKRKQSLQTSFPYDLEISMIYEPIKKRAKFIEGKLHKFFKNKHMRGEWFKNISNEEIMLKIKEIDK